MRRQIWIFGVLFALGVGAGMLGSRVMYAQSAAPTPRLVLRSDLQGVPGQEILITATDWAPGQRLPLHIHPGGHEFAYIVEGALTFEVEGKSVTTVKAGEVNHVLPDIPHFGRNDGSVLAKTIVVRIKDKDKPVVVPVTK
jgi:quercetin dioxygenase-like cupin family protein